MKEAQLGSGQMFDRIAHRYDLLNRLMSFGLDVRWRRRLVSGATKGLGEDDEVLDVATGTADLAIALAAERPGLCVTGVDPSCSMLALGRIKVHGRDLEDRVALESGDAQALPYADSRFAAATISFGIRNVPDRLQGLKEMVRVVRPGGKVWVLELSEPKGPARWYVHRVVPTLGALLSGQDEYRYLQRSIEAFPSPTSFAQLMRDAGLEGVSFRSLTFGAAHLYSGTKPEVTLLKQAA